MATILIVDANKDNLSFLTYLLGSDGYNVVQANSVKSGISILKVNITIDVLLTDFNLGDGVGSELLAHALPYTSTILYSVQCDMPSRYAPGFDDYISKTVDNQTILDTVANCVVSRRDSAMIAFEDEPTQVGLRTLRA